MEKQPLTATTSNPEAAAAAGTTSPTSANGQLKASTEQQQQQQRSHSLTAGSAEDERRELQCIAEESPSGSKNDLAHAQSATPAAAPAAATKPLTAAQQRRAHMVKKAIRYFEDKSNRSVSEDNLFTRRKNLAAHLGLDEKVSKREIQKINTYCLPVPSSATSFDVPDPTAHSGDLSRTSFSPAVKVTEPAAEVKVMLANPAALTVIEDEDEEEEASDAGRSKNLVSYLGMKDGITASMASQGSLCDTPRGSVASPPAKQQAMGGSAAAAAAAAHMAASDEAAAALAALAAKEADGNTSAGARAKVISFKF